MALDREIESSSDGALHRFIARFRAFMARHILLLWVYRILLIFLGFIFLVMGLIMLVTPGPGWLFIFLGMGIWGTEFHWAHRLNVWAKAKVLNIWRDSVGRVAKRRARKQSKLWGARERDTHYCPNGMHYH
ncbi:MAG: PGPGW domain-containing protein [Rothia sp. (in: high G+C Gram-positive bacteria)]|nr:PGPGW domain-containing protein [Rothia sp. (in: high G+C Gram-positive bacteria)]